MSNFSNSNKPVVVWVDHENDSVKEIIGKIGALRCTRTTMQPLSNSCDLVGVIVEPGDPLVERALAKIREVCPHGPDLVFVDLSFGPHDHPEAVNYGRELAIGLHKRLAPVPVGVYTKHGLLYRDRAQISTDRFAATFEDIRKMYEGTQRLGGDDWYELFNRAISKARNAAAVPPHAVTVPSGSVVNWAPGHPLHRSRSFSEAALKLAALALARLRLAPSQILLTELAGGFSGSFVVKADLPDRKPSFVIKIDEDLKKLEKELAGHQIVESTVEYQHYLPLVSGTAWPVKLYDDWWGAFAMAYEERAKPLLEHSQLEGAALATIYERVWNECLRHLYGPVGEKVLSTADVLSRDAKDAAKDGSLALKRYDNRLSELNGAQRSAIKRSLSLVEGSADGDMADGGSLSVPWVDRVHGDLNCRNVLYDIEQNTFRLIDFPHVGQPDCLAVDFVKAEAELVLIMMDWPTGWDCDFARLGTWGTLTSALSADFQPVPSPSPDAEINRVLSAIQAIRNTYEALAGTTGEERRAYRLYLLARVLRYIGYLDLTVAKRFLALIWAGQLAEAKW